MKKTTIEIYVDDSGNKYNNLNEYLSKSQDKEAEDFRSFIRNKIKQTGSYIDSSWADDGRSIRESYSNIFDITDFIVKYLPELNNMIKEIK